MTSAALSSISATTSWITVRTMRFLSRASAVGADQTASRLPVEEQEAYRAAGFGRPTGIGRHPALLIIDVQYLTLRPAKTRGVAFRVTPLNEAKMPSRSIIDDIVGLIDCDELVRFALEICNIDSAVGHEGEVGEHLYNWMRQQGFVARKIGLLNDRFNVLGSLPGTGGGYSLIFNSHMDTAVPREADLVHRNPAADVYHKAWIEG